MLVHVGDEDLFKTRSAAQTVERTRDLAHLVREYCPKSFVVLSTLMRRASRTENATVAEVNILNFKYIYEFKLYNTIVLICYFRVWSCNWFFIF